MYVSFGLGSCARGVCRHGKSDTHRMCENMAMECQLRAQKGHSSFQSKRSKTDFLKAGALLPGIMSECRGQQTLQVSKHEESTWQYLFAVACYHEVV